MRINAKRSLLDYRKILYYILGTKIEKKLKLDKGVRNFYWKLEKNALFSTAFCTKIRILSYHHYMRHLMEFLLLTIILC